MNRKWVTLREECEYVKQYLLILRHKLNTFSVVWEIDEEAFDTDILKLVLQPLVENAVLHGLGAKNAEGCLTITIQAMEHRTAVTVMDNGSGVSPEILVDIKQNFEKVRNRLVVDGPHIGLCNVYQRLFLEYGEQVDFTIESRQHYGTKLTFTIPKRHPPDSL
jgi:two-component system sensor histidine kinase YesM